jgi:hypothetical protein
MRRRRWGVGFGTGSGAEVHAPWRSANSWWRELRRGCPHLFRSYGSVFRRPSRPDFGGLKPRRRSVPPGSTRATKRSDLVPISMSKKVGAGGRFFPALWPPEVEKGMGGAVPSPTWSGPAAGARPSSARPARSNASPGNTPATVGQSRTHCVGPVCAARRAQPPGVKDIDLARGDLMVRSGKGGKDRRALLPGPCTSRPRSGPGESPIRRVIELHDRDVSRGLNKQADGAPWRF